MVGEVNLDILNDRTKKLYLLFGILGIGLLVTTLEVMSEGDTVSVFEFLYDSLEKSLIFAGAGGVFVLIRQMQMQQNERKELLRELDIARAEGGSWREKVRSFTNGLGSEIEVQFGDWGLSDAEREVGLLMIKGFSHKEIAELRGTAEATVRQQARTIYQKSGLPGKAAFSAYFLEDLLPPRNSSDTSRRLPS